MNKDLIEHIIDIKQDIGEIKQSQKDLKTTLNLHSSGIEINRINNEKINKKLAYWAGGMGALITITTIVTNIIL